MNPIESNAESGLSFRDARLERLLARNEILRFRVEQREAALAAAGPPLSAEQLYTRAIAAAIRGVDLFPTQEIAAQQCRDCKQVKSIDQFYSCLRDGKRRYHHRCKTCHGVKFNAQNRTLTAVRARLAAIEECSFKCCRCDELKPKVLFRDGERTCLPCKIEVLEAQKKALLERVPTGGEWKRESARRRRHGNPEKYATRNARRLGMILRQSDGTLTPEVVGRLFAEAEGKPCPYCGAYMDRTMKSLDHMIPIAKGGLNSAANAIICCLSCNTRKRDLDFGLWVAKLKEPMASLACAEYARRYGSKPDQFVLPLQFVIGETQLLN